MAHESLTSIVAADIDVQQRLIYHPPIPRPQVVPCKSTLHFFFENHLSCLFSSTVTSVHSRYFNGRSSCASNFQVYCEHCTRSRASLESEHLNRVLCCCLQLSERLLSSLCPPFLSSVVSSVPRLPTPARCPSQISALTTIGAPCSTRVRTYRLITVI